MSLEYLYRFRSVHALLDGYHELENQEIYFSPPDELNDPLEGFKDIFWRGDAIVWRNLLRHYLLNLLDTISIYGISGKEFDQKTCQYLVHKTESDLQDAPIRTIYKNACDAFLQHPALDLLITHLASESRAIRRDELRCHLRMLHPLATAKIAEELKRHGIHVLRVDAEFNSKPDEIAEKLQAALSARVQEPAMLDVIFAASENVMAQLALIQEANSPVPVDRQGWMFVVRDFPAFYVSSLERLIYPDWHTACFVADPTNASMWGVYGNCHQGACLKFRVNRGGADMSSLDLNRISSWSGRPGSITPNYSFVPHQFHEVHYTTDFPEIDFFESMGMIPGGKLVQSWLSDQNGNRSIVASRMLDGDKSWHEEHWNRYTQSFRTKSSEWAHEREHRLILNSMGAGEFPDKPSRKLKYRFSDLAGIVFGIKTSTQDKLAIMRVIEQKCRAENRNDFEFWQARYSHPKRKIELAPMTLLRIV